MLETTRQPPAGELAMQGEAPEMERVALGDGRHRREELRVRMSDSCRRKIGGDEVGGKRRQADRRRVPLEVPEQLLGLRAEARGLVAPRQDQEDPHSAALPREEAGEEEGGRVCQMGVVEHHDDGRRTRRAAQVLEHRQEPAEAPRRGLAGVLFEEVPGRLELPQDRPPRPERRSFALQPASADAHPRSAPAGPRGGLLGQTGLADPGGTLDHRDLAVALPGGAQHPHELADLGGPAHESRPRR